MFEEDFLFGPRMLMDQAGGDGAGGGGGGGDAGAGDAGAGDAGGNKDEGGDAGDAGGDQGAGDQGGDAGGDAGGDQGAGDQGAGGDDDWRTQYANGDDKRLNQLKRFTSQKALADSYFALQQKVSSGDVGKPPENATADQMTAWRAEKGIPEKADGYLGSLPEGMVLGDDDKVILQPYLEEAHKRNMSPEDVAMNIQHYQDTRDAEIQAEEDAVVNNDNTTKQAVEDQLRNEWGNDYRPNMNAVENFINTYIPEDAREAFMNARGNDEMRTPLLNNPQILMGLAQAARQINPTATTTAGQTLDNVQSIEDQLNAYQKQMGGKDWHKNDKAQQHYRDLVNAYKRQTGKDWG